MNITPSVIVKGIKWATGQELTDEGVNLVRECLNEAVVKALIHSHVMKIINKEPEKYLR